MNFIRFGYQIISFQVQTTRYYIATYVQRILLHMAEGSSVRVWGGGIAAPRPMFKFAATSFSEASQVTRKKESHKDQGSRTQGRNLRTISTLQNV